MKTDCKKVQENKDRFIRLMENFKHGIVERINIPFELTNDDGGVWEHSDQLIKCLRQYHIICDEIDKLTNLEIRKL